MTRHLMDQRAIRPDIAERFAAIVARAEARADAEYAAIVEEPRGDSPVAWRGKHGVPAVTRRARLAAVIGLMAWWFFATGGLGMAATAGPFKDIADCDALRMWLSQKATVGVSTSWCWWDGKP